MKRIILFIIALLLFCSCSNTYRVKYSQRTLDSYVGLSHSQIVELLGAPSDQVSDGSDGYILVFEGNKEIFDYSSRYAAKSSTRPQAQFYMSSDGVCQKVKTKHTDKVTVPSVGGTILLVVLILLII